MNRWLLIWNVILTILLAGIIFSGCSSIDPQFTNLQSQVKSNREVIEQLASAVNENRKLVAEQTQSILELRVYTEASLNQLRAKSE